MVIPVIHGKMQVVDGEVLGGPRIGLPQIIKVFFDHFNIESCGLGVPPFSETSPYNHYNH